VIRRLVNRLRRRIFKFFLPYIPVDDQWEPIGITVPLHQYGSGARLDFQQHLEGESIVTVESFAEIREWLSHCNYLSDDILFNERDFWQHPSTFERLRAGDCEDFALWAWRKMLELGMDADLVAGYCVKNGELDGRHAWVVYHATDKIYIYEPVLGTHPSAIRPLDEAKADYIPEFGVDRHATRFLYAGYLTVQKKLLANARAKKSAPLNVE
jgi:hypothetical protein